MSVAVVTGAGAGIGRAVALRLADDGWDVAVVDLDLASAEETAGMVEERGRRALPLQADVSKEEDVIGFVARAERDLGPIDGFVANAGIGGVYAPIHETPADVFDKVISVNARGVFLSLKYATAAMVPRGKGAVVVVASTSAIRGRNGSSPYVASKHAALGLTRVAALDLADLGVRVNAVLPGPIETDLIRRLMAQRPEGARLAGRRRTLGQPENVSGVVAFLLSDDAAHVTGASWVIDGGNTVD